MTYRTGHWAFAGLFWMLTGCVSDQPDYGPATGELGKGSLRVTCTADDPACDPGATKLAAGVAVAVGASFGMTYEGQIPKAPTGDPTTIVLFSASPSMLSLDVDQFVAWLPGQVAVIARTQEGTVTDFVHVALAEVARIELGAAEESSPLSVGQQGTWQATPRSSDETVLGGTLAYTWEVEGTAIEIASKGGRSATIVAREAGISTLRARTGQAVGETTITVEAAP